MGISRSFQGGTRTIMWGDPFESVMTHTFAGGAPMERVRHDETIREVMDRHPPYAATEEVARLDLRLRDLERRIARLERADRIAAEAVEIGGR